MKRCSQCHFIFEDYDQFCDFDRTELTPYPEAALSTKQTALIFEGSFFIRLFTSRVFLAILSLVGVISSALLIGYYDAASQPQFDTRLKSQNREASANQPRGLAQPQPGSPTQTLPASAGSRAQLSSQTRVQPVRVTVSNNFARQMDVQANDLSDKPPPLAATSLPRARARSTTPIKPKARMEPQTSHSEQNLERRVIVENAHPNKQSRANTILKKTSNALKKTGSLLTKPF